MEHHLHYRRILLKLSGESLSGDLGYGIDVTACNRFASAIGRLIHSGHEVGVVIGGGNICRGQQLKALGMARSPADQAGMLATIMNGLALRQALENQEIDTEIFTALQCPQVANLYNWSDANAALSEQKAVIFVGGTGNPYFTTDTAAALRASEIGADLLVKATKVDGIYNKDPKVHKDAVLYENLSYTDALREDLKVMDATSLALCRDNKIPILVLNMSYLENSQLPQIIQKRTTGTLVTGE
jgi:uridylate kinase